MEIILSFIQDTGHLILYYLIPFVVVLGVMIFFHELGHFLIAKYFRVKVLKFALGFGPKIVGKEIGETEYSIRYIPLGGFVKMLGEEEGEEESQDLSPEEAEKAFNNQHALKRIAIVTAGPIFNLVLALCLFYGILLVSGNYVMIPEIGQVTSNSPAERAGLKVGDVVLSAQGKEIEGWEDLKDLVQGMAGRPIYMNVLRSEQILSVTVTPEEGMVTNEFGEEVKSVLIGIVASGEYKKIELGPWKAFKRSFEETWRWIKLTCLVVVKLFQGVVSIKTVGGPIMIGQMTGQLAEESFSNLFPFMAIISVNLGILNLLPIPILDGGVIVFLIIELFMGRPISIKKRELAQKVGLSLLMILMIIVFYNDVLRLFE
jgi:regulator of sigma E protease